MLFLRSSPAFQKPDTFYFVLFGCLWVDPFSAEVRKFIKLVSITNSGTACWNFSGTPEGPGCTWIISSALVRNVFLLFPHLRKCWPSPGLSTHQVPVQVNTHHTYTRHVPDQPCHLSCFIISCDSVLAHAEQSKAVPRRTLLRCWRDPFWLKIFTELSNPFFLSSYLELRFSN